MAERCRVPQGPQGAPLTNMEPPRIAGILVVIIASLVTITILVITTVVIIIADSTGFAQISILPESCSATCQRFASLGCRIQNLNP